MELGLAGNVVAVFGAARGIGAAIARAFAAEGRARRGHRSRPDASSISPRTRPQCSGPDRRRDRLSMPSAAWPQRSRDRFGRCDHVVFAVGVGSGKFGFPFWKLEPADWERVLKVNLIGAVNVAHAFAPAMAEARPIRTKPSAPVPSRSMLFLSSVAGQIGSQTDPPYSAAKAAVINFAQCAAKDLAPHGVRVNTLCPGMVQTPLNRSVYEAWAREQPESELPFLRSLDRRQDQEARPPEPMAAARGHRRHGRLPRLEPGTQHHRPDHQCRWRLRHALVIFGRERKRSSSFLFRGPRYDSGLLTAVL